MSNIVGKVWGDTSVLIQNTVVELHKINAKAGYRCSEHKHAHKWNGFYVISGVLEIHVRKNDYALTDVTTLRAGDFTTVRPGEYHWFKCVEDCSALELYYPEMLTEDIQRKSVGGVDTDKTSLHPVYKNVTITDVETGVEYNHRVIDEFGTPNSSPCTNICKIDPTTFKCIGCGRTAEEIREDGLKYAANRYKENKS